MLALAVYWIIVLARIGFAFPINPVGAVTGAGEVYGELRQLKASSAVARSFSVRPLVPHHYSSYLSITAPKKPLVDLDHLLSSASGKPISIIRDLEPATVQIEHLIKDPMLNSDFPSHLQALAKLGDGAYARSFLVRDSTSESTQPFVLKAFGVKDRGWVTSSEMIHREWEMINNPAVNLGAGEIIRTSNGKDYLPMKYVKGREWQSIIYSQLDRPENIQIAQKLKEEINRLHAAGIVHGDIAARNVIVDEITHHPTIIDYGMARYRGSFASEQEEQMAMNEDLKILKLFSLTR